MPQEIVNRLMRELSLILSEKHGARITIKARPKEAEEGVANAP